MINSLKNKILVKENSKTKTVEIFHDKDMVSNRIFSLEDNDETLDFDDDDLFDEDDEEFLDDDDDDDLFDEDDDDILDEENSKHFVEILGHMLEVIGQSVEKGYSRVEIEYCLIFLWVNIISSCSEYPEEILETYSKKYVEVGTFLSNTLHGAMKSMPSYERLNDELENEILGLVFDIILPAPVYRHIEGDKDNLETQEYFSDVVFDLLHKVESIGMNPLLFEIVLLSFWAVINLSMKDIGADEIESLDEHWDSVFQTLAVDFRKFLGADYDYLIAND